MSADRFNVYVRFKNRRLNNRHTMTNRTTTYEPEVAARELLALIKRDDLAGKGLCAVLTWNGRELMFHDFDAPVGATSRLASDQLPDVVGAMEARRRELESKT